MRWPPGRTPVPRCLRYLCVIGCLTAVVMASEAGACALFSLPTSFPTGDGPFSVAVADLVAVSDK